jgi:hypothetical protein
MHLQKMRAGGTYLVPVALPVVTLLVIASGAGAGVPSPVIAVGCAGWW